MTRDRMRSLLAVLLLAGAGLLMCATPAGAADSSAANEWQFDGNIYLWAPSLNVGLQDGGEIELSFSDILDDLQFTFMGGVGASKGKWSFKADVMYLRIRDAGGAGYATLAAP